MDDAFDATSELINEINLEGTKKLCLEYMDDAKKADYLHEAELWRVLGLIYFLFDIQKTVDDMLLEELRATYRSQNRTSIPKEIVQRLEDIKKISEIIEQNKQGITWSQRFVKHSGTPNTESETDE